MSQPRRALGKGLRSLIPEAAPKSPVAAPIADKAEPLVQVDLDLVGPNPQQPREAFEDAALAELAASLKSRGVLQPIVVRPVGAGRYELVAGERRWRAAQLAGLLKIPAIVRHVGDEDLLELALIENLQRENLNPIEEGRAYQKLIDLGLTQQDVADRVGKPRATVANTLRLLNLPLEVQERIRAGAVSAGHAKALVSITNTKTQIDLTERIEREGLSVREVESIVARLGKAGVVVTGTPIRVQRDPNVVAAETSLQSALATKVRIVESGKNRGRVEIGFHSSEELDRLYRVLIAGARAGSN